MEVIELFSQKEKDEVIREIERIIQRARMLNAEGKKSVSDPMTGTEYLHGLMLADAIDHRMYMLLRRITEDPNLEYEIRI